MQRQLDELKDVKQAVQQIEQQSKEAVKQAAVLPLLLSLVLPPSPLSLPLYLTPTPTNISIKDDKWAAELKLRQAESTLDQAVQAKSKLESDCRLAIEETTKLRMTIDELQRELRSEKQKLQVC